MYRLIGAWAIPEHPPAQRVRRERLCLMSCTKRCRQATTQRPRRTPPVRDPDGKGARSERVAATTPHEPPAFFELNLNDIKPRSRTQPEGAPTTQAIESSGFDSDALIDALFSFCLMIL